MTTTTDQIYESFLWQQLHDARALSRDSDLVDLVPLGDEPPTKYLARFRCRGLVKTATGVDVADRFDVGIRFPADYLRRAEVTEVLTWLGPREVFHPNISDIVPVMCIGPMAPGMSLVDIVYQTYEVISYQNVTMREDDALNGDACVWARRHRDRFPLDRRPLKRRTLTALDATVSQDRGQS